MDPKYLWKIPKINIRLVMQNGLSTHKKHGWNTIYLKDRLPLDVRMQTAPPTVNKSTDALDCIFYGRKFE